MSDNLVKNNDNDKITINKQQKTYLISIRGEDYDGMMFNDIKCKASDPSIVADNFIKINKIKNATLYISEMKNCYKMGNMVFTDKSLAEKNAEIYGLNYEKQVLMDTVEVRKV
jgi:hypothetical protein